jgi:hypothetical protein
MATPDEVKKQKELNDLLTRENEILKKRLELQSESYDLSSSLVENLKDVLGIQSKRNTFDSGLLDINKKINQSIRDQKTKSENINEVQKQIKKNKDLINKATLFEKSLETQLNSLGAQKAQKDKNRIKNINEYNNALNKYYKSLEEILSLSKEERDARKDELENLKNKIAKNERLVESNFRNMSLTAKQFYLTKQQTAELEKQNKIRLSEESILKRQAKLDEMLEKRLGVGGGVLKALSKISFLKNLGVDFEKASEAAKETTKKTKSGVEGMIAGLSNIGSQLFKIITNVSSLFVGAIVLLGKTLLDIDKSTGKLAKDFNITYLEANNLRKELTQMAYDSNSVVVNTRALQESMVAVGKALGTNAVLNEKDLVTFTKLREAAGLTNEELIEQQKLTYISGRNLENNVGSLLASAKITGLNNKTLLNEKDILKDVSNTSYAIKASLGGSGKALGEAAAQAKVLGMSMKQVEDIAGSLLNFESSISAELEAELLTGKNLNLEMARLYAINNDMAGVAREIRKNYGSIEEFGRMNRIQQEAAAKAVGMTREELAKTLTDEKALAGLQGEQRNAAQAALEFARAKGMSEEQIRKTSITDLEKQQSIQERLNASVEKLKEVFVEIAEATLPFFNGFANLVTNIAKSKGAVFVLKAALVGLAAIFVKSAIAAIWTGLAALGPLGAGLAIAATAAFMSSIGEASSGGGATTTGGTTSGQTAITPSTGEGVSGNTANNTINTTPRENNNQVIMGAVSRMTDNITTLANQVKSMSQQPIYVSAKVNDRELLAFNANRANERSNLERPTAYRIQ